MGGWGGIDGEGREWVKRVEDICGTTKQPLMPTTIIKSLPQHLPQIGQGRKVSLSLMPRWAVFQRTCSG